MKRFDLIALTRVTIASLCVWTIAACAGAAVGSTGAIGFVSYDTIMYRLTEHVLPASLIGAALASAGVIFQAILRNPLADPYLLGASGGAMLATYIWRLNVVASATWIATVSPHAMAMLGALAAVAIVLLAAGWRGRIEPVTAILVGVIVSSICGAVFMLLNSIYRDLPGTGGLMSMLAGDVQTTASRQQIQLSIITVSAGWLILFFLTPSLNVIRLSDGEAQSLGVRVQRTRWTGLIVASLVTAGAVAISGPIGFVGLICPHVARFFYGNDNRRLLPFATALGAGLLVLADAIARLLLANDSVGTLIPVGVITALVGGPFMLVILMRMKR